MSPDPEQAATDSLIAQLLASDGVRLGGYGGYEVAEDEASTSDTSYDTPRKLRKGGRGCGGAGAKKRGGRPASLREPPIGSGTGTAVFDAAAAAAAPPGRRRPRSDTGKPRAAGKPWNDQEECAFLKGLEEHGRDWRSVAAAIGSRGMDAVKSHAQRHFIKLAMSGQGLPARVAASGPGYTLSGCPLDPSSAGALQNGFRVAHLAELSSDELEVVRMGLLREKLPEEMRESGGGSGSGGGAQCGPDTEADGAAGSAGGADSVASASTALQPARPPVSRRKRSSGGGAAAPGAAAAGVPGAVACALPSALSTAVALKGTLQAAAAVPPPTTQPPPVAAPPTTQPSPVAAVPLPPTQPPPVGTPPTATQPPPPQQRTEYALSRPQRATARAKLSLGATTESSMLVQPLQFLGLPASGAPLSQPFHMRVAAAALAVADLQAHLCACEVIGLLGGRWDAERHTLSVDEAYPCRCTPGAEAQNAVELDAVAEVEVRALMEARGQRCVGWYHSHPVFEPSPSQKDMENQRNYQALFRDAVSRAEPFIGFIVSPYDAALPGPCSALTAFLVQQRASSLVPYALRYTLEGTNAAPPVELIRPKIMQLVAMFRGDPARVHLDALWRAFSWLRAGMPEGPPLTKASKLRVSLARYLCDAPQTDVQSLLDLVDTELQADSDVCSAAPASCNISVEQAQELSMEYASTQTPTAK